MNKIFTIFAVASLFPSLIVSLNPSNYLQSLSPPNHHPPSSGGAATSSSSSWIPLETYGRPYKPPQRSREEEQLTRTLRHASMEYFRFDKLTPEGPRDNVDIGTPHQASRSLVNHHMNNINSQQQKLAAGSWWCSAGGWPEHSRRSTEIFFVWTGRGCLTDKDGAAHDFGPGDTVIVPKGWCGRWDMWEDVQKIWFVHEHAKVEEQATADFPCIRAHVTPYEKLMAPQYLHPLAGGPGAASRLLYAAGPTTVGSVMCAPGSSSKTCHDAECFHLLEGILFLTDDDNNGTSQRCVAGDTVFLPPGWSGHHDVVEKTTMLWISMEKEEDLSY
eukprot:scaffold22432_cov168-Amphora_coffeaeformis.AAC.16